MRWKYWEVGISMPRIGMVLRNSMTNSMEIQDIKIAYVFSQHDLNIHISNEI